LTSKPARNHHWVPQFYLKRFTNKDGMLHCFDLEQRKLFQTKPKGVGAQRDFNRVDIEGYPIDAIEQALSPLESEIDHAIAAIMKQKQVGYDKNAHLLFNLIALLAVRNPNYREARRHSVQMFSERIMDSVLATPERYESQIRKAKEAGFINSKSNVSYEQAKNFHERKEYTFKVAREAQIKEEFELLSLILETLGRREWTFIETDLKTGLFITCDHPVLLRQNTPTQHPTPLGFGHHNTDVIFPLSRNACVVGSFKHKAQHVNATSRLVADFNTDLFLSGPLQTYWTNKESILHWTPTRKIVEAEDFFKRIQNLLSDEEGMHGSH